MNPAACPLCGGTTKPFHADERRDYVQCTNCDLVSVPRNQHLPADAEKRHYDLHENSPDDPGYRRFLHRAVEPLIARLSPPAAGLDFGSGPGPTLSVMLTELGYAMSLYDPYYTDDAALAQDRTYDFITATEVFEHLARPGEEIANLLRHLRRGGWLIVMTKRAGNRAAFADWHYIRDPTHVSFFTERTFRWLADHHGLSLEVIGPDVAALRKA